MQPETQVDEGFAEALQGDFGLVRALGLVAENDAGAKDGALAVGEEVEAAMDRARVLWAAGEEEEDVAEEDEEGKCALDCRRCQIWM